MYSIIVCFDWRSSVPTKGEIIGTLIFACCLVGIPFILFLFAPSPSPTSAKISQGVQKMIIRLPPTPSLLQEDVLITGTGASEDWTIVRGPAEITSGGVVHPFNDRQLTVGEWAQMDAQREAWCADFPVFEPIPEGEPYYDVAIRCGRVIDYDTEQFLVPLDALPEAFVMLIEALPSPQEDC